MRIFFNLLAILVVLFTNCFVIRGQNGHLNFSQGSTNNEVATLANTGFGGVRTGGGGGGWSLVNSLSPSIGAGFRLRGIAPTSGAVNSVGLTSTQYGTASTASTISFEVTFNNSPGTWSFFVGNGATFGSAQNVGFTGNQVHTGIRWTVASGGVITTAYRNGNGWTNLVANTFAGSTQYTVTVVSNNTTASVNYDGGQSVAANSFDLWVNGVLVGDNLAKAELPSGTSINAFRFYGETSASNLSNIFLDNIKWWNSCVAPSVSIYGVSAPATNTYMDCNVYSDVTLSNPVTVLGSVEIPNANTLTTNDNLTLGSNATFTGRIGATVGNLTGNLTVQRFIPQKPPENGTFLHRLWLLPYGIAGSSKLLLRVLVQVVHLVVQVRVTAV